LRDIFPKPMLISPKIQKSLAFGTLVHIFCQLIVYALGILMQSADFWLIPFDTERDLRPMCARAMCNAARSPRPPQYANALHMHVHMHSFGWIIHVSISFAPLRSALGVAYSLDRHRDTGTREFSARGRRRARSRLLWRFPPSPPPGAGGVESCAPAGRLAGWWPVARCDARVHYSLLAAGNSQALHWHAEQTHAAKCVQRVLDVYACGSERRISGRCWVGARAHGSRAKNTPSFGGGFGRRTLND
jgi:hypothetical protein